MKTSLSTFKKASLLCSLLFASPALMLAESDTVKVPSVEASQKAVDKVKDKVEQGHKHKKEYEKKAKDHVKGDKHHHKDKAHHHKKDMDKKSDSAKGEHSRLDLENTHFAERILAASPEEIAQIRQLLDKIEKMSPDEKQNALEKIKKNRREFGERRRAFDNLSAEQREALRKMSPEERREAFQKMFPDARQMGPSQGRPERGPREFPGRPQHRRPGSEQRQIQRPDTSEVENTLENIKKEVIAPDDSK